MPKVVLQTSRSVFKSLPQPAGILCHTSETLVIQGSLQGKGKEFPTKVKIPGWLQVQDILNPSHLNPAERAGGGHDFSIWKAEEGPGFSDYLQARGEGLPNGS